MNDAAEPKSKAKAPIRYLADEPSPLRRALLSPGGPSPSALESLGIPPKAASRASASILSRPTPDYADASPNPPRFLLQASEAPEISRRVKGSPSREASLLLLSLLALRSANPHPSGWIRYDRRQAFRIAGLAAAKESLKASLCALLAETQGLEMRVVGSASPTPCFRFAWAPSAPEGETVDCGPLLPGSAEAVLEALSE